MKEELLILAINRTRGRKKHNGNSNSMIKNWKPKTENRHKENVDRTRGHTRTEKFEPSQETVYQVVDLITYNSY